MAVAERVDWLDAARIAAEIAVLERAGDAGRVRDVAACGHIPSFCAACYRMGRTGQDFMDLAGPGLIGGMRGPNALSSFMEYMLDDGSDETVGAGEQAVAAEIARRSETMMRRVCEGKRDVFR